MQNKQYTIKFFSHCPTTSCVAVIQTKLSRDSAARDVHCKALPLLV